MTALRIFRTNAPLLCGAPVLPMDPHEQWVLDELRRRRAAGQSANKPSGEPAGSRPRTSAKDGAANGGGRP